LLIDIDYTANWAEQTITWQSKCSCWQRNSNHTVPNWWRQPTVQTVLQWRRCWHSVVVPVKYSLIEEFVIFVNGALTTDYTFVPYSTTSTEVVFATPYTINDYLMIGAIGPTTIDGHQLKLITVGLCQSRSILQV
jgi:hypothetical protein